MKRRKQRPENIIRHHVDWARVSFYQKKTKRGPDFIGKATVSVGADVNLTPARKSTSDSLKKARSRSFTIDGMTGPRCTSTRMPLGIRTLGLRGCPDTDRLLETVGHGIVIENKEGAFSSLISVLISFSDSVLLRNISPISVYVKSSQIDSTPIRIPAAHEVDLFFYNEFSRSIAERNTLADLWELREQCTLFISFGLCWGSSTVQVENIDALPCWLKVKISSEKSSLFIFSARLAALLERTQCRSGTGA
jgi:hypothetical protein